jgi:hypothetical protein
MVLTRRKNGLGMVLVLFIVSRHCSEAGPAMQAEAITGQSVAWFPEYRMVRILPEFQDFGCVLFPLFSGYIAPHSAMKGYSCTRKIMNNHKKNRTVTISRGNANECDRNTRLAGFRQGKPMV